MNFTLEIKASKELLDAIYTLSNAMSVKPELKVTPENNQQEVKQSQPEAVPDTAPVQTQQPTAVPTQQPVQQQAPVPTQQPAPVQQQAPTAVPTAQASYTMEQLAVAATQLVDAGKREDLVGLLSSFGVQALNALPQEHYGTFATKLREMGAKI